MSELWKMVLSLSLSGSVLIVGIFLFCHLFRKKLSKSWQYYIWLAVVARLLIPWSGEINLVGQAFSAAEQYVGQREMVAALVLPDSESSESQETVSEAQTLDTDGFRSAAVPVADRPTETRFPEALCALWLVGAVILLIRKLTLYQNFVCYLQTGSMPGEPVLLEALGQIAEELRIKGPVELSISPLSPSPLLVGILRPVVVLPTAELSEEDFRYTVLHELTHCRRMDILYKWLVQLTVCLHWFNPLVWLLARETDRACELSCDEAVIRKLTEEEKRAYGDTLLRAAKGAGSWKGSVPAVTLHESGKLLKGRLEAILMEQKRSMWIKALSLILAVAVAGGAAALGAYAKPREEKTARFTSGGNDFLLEDGISVIERDQVFYILCDGLTEDEAPLVGVVDGTMIMVVHRGLSTSVTLTANRGRVFEDAKKVCREMVEWGRLSEKDADLVLETAEKIQEGETDDLFSERFFEGSYYQSAYYRAPYLFYVGYDLTEEAAARCAGTEISLESGEKLWVSFSDTGQKWMEDEAFLSVLQALFSEFRTKEGKRIAEIKRPVVSSVEEVGFDVEALTEVYYASGDIGRFSVMIGELSPDRQKEYIEKAFQQEDAAVFSIILGELEWRGQLKDTLLDAYLSRAYEDRNVAFFAILSDYLSEASAQEWYRRISDQESLRSPYDSILWDRLYNTEEDWDW